MFLNILPLLFKNILIIINNSLLLYENMLKNMMSLENIFDHECY